MPTATRRFETPFAMTLRPGEADDLRELERHRYFWTGWKRRHWPAGVLRPGLLIYGFDTRTRHLRVLLKITRGGSFTYQTKREFATKVARLAGWEPDELDSHWASIPKARDASFCTGIALRWAVVKGVRIPLALRFPQLGFLRLDSRQGPAAYADPAEEFLEGGRQVRRHMAIERSATLRARAKDLWREHLGRLRCLVCKFDFERAYGSLGSEFIEMHHEVAVSTYHVRRRITPEQLKPLCANCHRMVHRERPFLSIGRLRALRRREA